MYAKLLCTLTSYCIIILVYNFFQVRRTRISERMRKLQELVPNMDKVNFHLHFSFKYKFFCKAYNVFILFPKNICSKQTHQTCWIWLWTTLKIFRTKSRYLFSKYFSQNSLRSPINYPILARFVRGEIFFPCSRRSFCSYRIMSKCTYYNCMIFGTMAKRLLILLRC